MKILLIKPYNLSDHIQPSLGLGYLATSIRKKHDIKIVDCIKEKISAPSSLLKIVREFEPDVVGMQCYTFHLKFIKDVLEGVKRINNEIVCAVGGPHPSVAPVETMEWFSETVDYGFIGEAEIGFPKLLDAISFGNSYNLKSIAGLIWKEDGKVKFNSPKLVEDLDSFGAPAWDLIRPETYPEAQHGAFYKKFPIAPILATRGCPYLCTFCAAKEISGKKIRKHSVNYILNQVEMLYKDYGIREFHIIDDNFTFDMNYAKDVVRGLIDLNLDISWATPNGVRLNKLDDELLSLMKKSGLYLISLGIESGSDRILKLMKKGTTVKKIENGIKMIRKAGIDIAGFFILGYPGETKEDIEKTIQFSCDLDLLRANFFTYLPLPGTKSFEQLKEKSELEKVAWDNYFFTSAAYVSGNITRHELKMLQRKAFLKFFFRPNIFIKNVLQIKSYNHFKFIVRRFYYWIIKGI